LDHLDERLRLKLHRWMHGQSAKLQECHSDWPATCPHFVVEVAVKAERVPVPDGWNHPSFSKSSSFGPWLQCVAFRLHDVYSSVHPQTLHLSGLMEVAPLLRSMQLDLSSQLRVGIEETCLLYEPVAPDEPDVEVTSATGLADFPAGSLDDCFGRDTVLLKNLYVRGAWWSSSGLHVDRGIRNLMPFPPIRIRATLPEGAENALHAKYPATPACMDVPVWRFMRSVPGGGHDVVKLLTVRLPVTIVTDHCPVVLCDAPPLHMAGGAA